MGKVSNRSSMVSPRRRLLKTSPGVGGFKKSRNTTAAKACLPAPPKAQPFVDEDSGFGGDQSLDSESSLLSSSGSSNTSGGNLTSYLPSLSMVPQTGVDGKVNFSANRLPVDVSGEEAQELPGNLGSKNSRHIPPLISFRDVTLLSSFHSLSGNTRAPVTPVVCVEANPHSKAQHIKTEPSSVSTYGFSSLTGNTQHIKTESLNVSSCGFPPLCTPLSSKSFDIESLNVSSCGFPPLCTPLSSKSSDGSVELVLISQPEEQHRARYQTEGSRGAVKDRDGKGHPMVKLVRHKKSNEKPTLVQVYVGDDSPQTNPHMFYQVCRVMGKNSTPCKEKQIEGTAVIESVLEPKSDMTMSCDCVGILKERNVDVEHRFKAVVARGRKKSTKCCLVFRTLITLPNGTQETLQVVSKSIACTQPPGVPEICRKSLSSCKVSGGEDIFILGKNFSKDTVVIFQEIGAKAQSIWEQTVVPEKETLQPIHLVVTVPKYYNENIVEEVTVQMLISSGNKISEPYNFTYLPKVMKKEVQVQGYETSQEKSLPKGVSLGALQLNHQYTKSRKITSTLQEMTQRAVKPSHSSKKMTAIPVSALPKSVAAAMQAPCYAQNSAHRRKNNGRNQRNSSLVSKTHSSINKNALTLASNHINTAQTLVASPCIDNTAQEVAALQGFTNTAHIVTSQSNAANLTQNVAPASLIPCVVDSTVENIPSTLPSINNNAVQNVNSTVAHQVEATSGIKRGIEGGSKNEIKIEEKGTVNLDSVVELLSIVKNLPTGSIEALVKSMKQKTVNPEKSHEIQDSTDSAPLVPKSNLLMSQEKIKKMAPQVDAVTQQEAPKIALSSSLTSTVGLWPLTFFSPLTYSSQSTPNGPKVARVAPIAPTTVVSSPGLARAVRVCVGEAPSLSLEPPKKKQCDHSSDLNYELVERNQLGREPVINNSVSSVGLHNPVIPFRNMEQPIAQKYLNDQCNTPRNITVPAIINSSKHTFIHSPSQESIETSNALTAKVESALNNNSVEQQSQQPIYQSITQSLLQTIAGSPQQVNSSINMPVQQVTQPMDINLSQEVNRPQINNVTVSQNPSQTPLNITFTQGGNAQTLNMNLSQEVTQQPLTVSLNQDPSVSKVSASLGHHISEPMNVSLSHSNQEGTQPVSVTLSPQNIQETNQTLNVPCLSNTTEVTQNIHRPEHQIITQHTNHHELNISQVVPTVSSSLFIPSTNIETPVQTTVSGALFTSSTDMVTSLPAAVSNSLFTPPSDMSVSDSATTGVLFNTPNNIGTASELVVASQSIIPTSSASIQQQTPLVTQSVASSNLPASDPLLSQSVTVSLQQQQHQQQQQQSQQSQHLGIQNGTVQQTRSEPEPRHNRTEVLLTGNATSVQVSMQNEVSSAINLSETELLNYFDPNCFDNV